MSPRNRGGFAELPTDPLTQSLRSLTRDDIFVVRALMVRGEDKDLVRARDLFEVCGVRAG